MCLNALASPRLYVFFFLLSMHYVAEQQKINTPVFFSSSHHNVLTRNIRAEKERNRRAKERVRARTENKEKVLFGFEKHVKEFMFTWITL